MKMCPKRELLCCETAFTGSLFFCMFGKRENNFLYICELKGLQELQTQKTTMIKIELLWLGNHFLKVSILSLLTLFFFTLCARAQYSFMPSRLNFLAVTPPDSTLLVPPFNDSLHNRQTSLEMPRGGKRLLTSLQIGVPLFTIGLCTYANDHSFKDMRNAYIPRFRFHYDDYLQYSPAAVMLGMKSLGLPSRDSWGRMLASDAFSTAIMAVVVNSLKLTVHKERPDGSDNNSFPSGHTATAFMCASMLSREYSGTCGPFVSIGAYSLATATAISRQLNNKHWFSDVLAGAGIGIMSTQLGYFISDAIFKNRGLQHPDSPDRDEADDGFSWLGLQMGYGLGEHEVDLPHHIEIEGYQGATTSLEGVWAFNRHWGIGGKLSFSQISPGVSSSAYFKSYAGTEAAIDHFETKPMTFSALLAGIQYSHRIFPTLYVSGNLMGGVEWPGNYTANVQLKGSTGTIPFIYCETHATPDLDFTLRLTGVRGNNLGASLFINYNVGMGSGQYSYYDPLNVSAAPETGSHTYILHNVYVGIEVAALFWR